MIARLLPIITAAALVAAAPADGATRLTIKGGGWGHGIGMSQYGAYGFALKGRDYREIVGHYYSGTRIGTTSNETVRVLLASSGTAYFTGADRAGGRDLDPGKVYGAERYGSGKVTLLSPAGRALERVDAPLVARGPSLTTGGERYRGSLEFQPGTFGGVDTVNALPLESYIRGVVPRESPSSWPIEALKAQALAARTYAITTSRSGTFDHYKDTRSQVYGGMAAETASTDEAIRATRGEVVTYDGEPVVTYFFSTSGGRTENVENVFIGAEPKPWLKSVEDPYDDASPYHRWRLRLSGRSARARLGSLARGAFRGIEVLERGESPRVVRARVVGKRGRVATTGPTLRARLGLRDTWARFKTVRTKATRVRRAHTAGRPATAAPPVVGVLRGSVVPGRRGRVVRVERRSGERWKAVGSVQLGRGGGYRFDVAAAGRYRVAGGPPVRVRG